ncbi:hypothetical protein NSK11_contig00137-0003 [Nocardia seriolae]|nr:hypothetical protein NS07_v2contig00133-0002 [Nocardia seriolae]GAP32005.1 hypothetical protein NSK11_contig00137-0003 [Nocardia seriolae]
MPLRLAVIAVLVLALLFWPYPSGFVVAGLALTGLVLLAAVEFLGRADTGTESP